MKNRMMDLNENCFLDALLESTNLRPQWGEDNQHFTHRVFDAQPDTEEWFRVEWKLTREPDGYFYREIEKE